MNWRSIAIVVGHVAVFSTPEARSQEIQGEVVLMGWNDPAAGARVWLLDSGNVAVDSTLADIGGRFAFRDVAVGTYFLQAAFENRFSQLAGPIVFDGPPSETVILDIPWPLFDKAMDCLAREREGKTGVLAGIAFETGNDTPLPFARVLLQWERDGQANRGRLQVTADGGGRYVFCTVPAGKPLSVWVQAFGAVSPPVSEILVEPDVLSRLDLEVELAAVVGSISIATETKTDADRLSSIEGTVLESGTQNPVVGALVALVELERQTVTDRLGRFRFAGVPAGTYTADVQRLGYHIEPSRVQVMEATALAIELRVSPRAIALEAVVVRTYSERETALRATPHATRILAGEPMRSYAERGVRIVDVVRDIPNVQMLRHGWYLTSDGEAWGPCVQSARRTMRLTDKPPERVLGNPALPWCDMVEVVFDGIPVARPMMFLESLNLDELESIEFLHPTAAFRWGIRAANNGALVLWSRGKGPHVNPARDQPRRDR